MKKYNLAVCGGTFDLLHSGHKKFLNDILEISENVLIGLTSDSYARSKNLEIQNFDVRKKELEDFLNSRNTKKRFEIVLINDKYGPLLEKDLNADVLIVTTESKKGAIEINEERKENGLSELPIEVIEMAIGIDNGIISSTRIRKGIINRNGRPYFKNEWKEKDLILPDNLRNELSQPFGEVIKDFPQNLEPEKVITIGDVTTKKFNKKFGEHFLSIIDYQVQRKKEFSKISELGFKESQKLIKVKNAAGGISSGLSGVILNNISGEEGSVILVDGEEDLAVLAVLLLVPLGFIIFYGQPREGLIKVEVTEKNKEIAYKLVDQFV